MALPLANTAAGGSQQAPQLSPRADPPAECLSVIPNVQTPTTSQLVRLLAQTLSSGVGFPIKMQNFATP